jgi:hypothetical protein
MILTAGNTLRPPLEAMRQTAESLEPVTMQEAERKHICKTLAHN